MDDSMAIVCGSEDGERDVTYVVDATSGRVASIPTVDCDALVADEERSTLLVGGNWVDLTRRSEGPWPLLVALSKAPTSVALATKAPANTVGLYCRIGDQLAPAVDCPAVGR